VAGDAVVGGRSSQQRGALALGFGLRLRVAGEALLHRVQALLERDPAGVERGGLLLELAPAATDRRGARVELAPSPAPLLLE
jgi:hypothetical protein